ncbi:MAG: hypothetical protein BA863_10990 [Desulfovibrio sp. S3730MH75]|nr:MAG: hypothetical protein BA863_10990 [Desulfovibrio sp. S3730MH75]
MKLHGPPLRVAILGARGIGKVHARIFHDLGTSVCAVLGSREETASLAAQDLAESFGIEAKPFYSYGQLLQEPLDAVSVCTPADMHFEQMLAAFNADVAVFCEKPLFWEEGLSPEKARRQLDILERHPNRKLFVNTSNTFFADTVRNKLGALEQAKSFTFKFHTQGRYRGDNIAVDLFPHGASLLLRLFGLCDLTAYSSEVSDYSYHASFMYGPACRVEFDFREGPDVEKAFIFSVDGHEFHRVQEGQGATYQAYLVDAQTGQRHRIDDPFRVAISDFCGYCAAGHRHGTDGFVDAAANLRMMVQCLEAPDNIQIDRRR